MYLLRKVSVGVVPGLIGEQDGQGDQDHVFSPGEYLDGDVSLNLDWDLLRMCGSEKTSLH